MISAVPPESNQLLCRYTNKQGCTPPLSFLSHSPVSLVTMTDELRGGTDALRRADSLTSKVCLTLGHVMRVPMTTRLEGSLDISLIKENTTCASEQPGNHRGGGGGGDADM